MAIVVVNPKLVSSQTLDADDVTAGFKRLLNFDSKFFYVTFKSLSTLAPKFKKYFCRVAHNNRLCKIFEEQSQEFYREKRGRLKKKVSIREKFPTPQITLFKQQIKVAFLYENVHNKSNAHEHFKHAYDAIVAVLPQLEKTFDIWEIKGVADFLFAKLAHFMFAGNEARHVINMFCSHYPRFKQRLAEVQPGQLYLEYRWRAGQLKRMSDFLATEIQAADLIKKKEVTMWVSFLHSVSYRGHKTSFGSRVQRC